MSQTLSKPALFLMIFLVALLPRVFSLGKIITVDEPTWIGRSQNFVVAFRNWKLEETLQSRTPDAAHPGVTTMWLGGTGLLMQDYVQGNLGVDPPPYFFARLPIALTISAMIAFSAVLILDLFGPTVALLAGFMVALDPFYIALSRLLHVDGLLASFILVSILAFLVYIKNTRSIFLILSGVFGGLAVLTKVPALALLPFLIVVRAMGISIQSWRTAIRDLVVWLAVAGGTMFVLWPALWVAPLNALGALAGGAVRGGTVSHGSTAYIWEPWYYLNSIYFFGQPVTLALFVFALGFSAFVLLKTDLRRKNFSLVGLVFFVVFFVVGMTIGAKKGERYILPVYPIINISAAVLAVYLMALVSKVKLVWGRLLVGLLLGLLVLQSYFALRTHPYYLAYHNPLAINAAQAKMGLGEGLELAAAYLNAKTNAQSLIVASWYPGIFGSFFVGEVKSLDNRHRPEVDYVIIYRGMFGRGEGSPTTTILNEYYPAQSPEQTIIINGLEYVWIYSSQQ